MRAVCLPDARKTMFHWMCQAAASCTTNSVFNRTKDVSLLLTTDAIVFQAAKDACTGAVSTRGKDVEVANSGVGEKVVLATVKGDVHDLGKTIVGILLRCNGYFSRQFSIPRPVRFIDCLHQDCGCFHLEVCCVQALIAGIGD